MMISMRYLKKITSVYIYISVLCIVLALSGCNSVKKSTISHTKHASFKKPPKNPFRYQGSYKIGKPYKIKKIKYYPKNYTKYVSSGIASWYGERDGFHGKPTANGDIFDKDLLTAAHKTLPLPSIVKVTNLENNQSAILMVNDRGPFCAKRLLDVSENAAAVLGFKMKGTAKVQVVYLEKETKALMQKLQLASIDGSFSAADIQNPTCSVDCYIKTVNIKHNIIPSTTMVAYNNNNDYFAGKLNKRNDIDSSKITLVNDSYVEEADSIFSETSAIIVKSPPSSRQKSITPRSGKHDYYIVVGKFKTISQTNVLLTKLKKYGPTRVSRINKNFHIKLGPINNFSKAKEVATKIVNITGTKAHVVKNNQRV